MCVGILRSRAFSSHHMVLYVGQPKANILTEELAVGDFKHVKRIMFLFYFFFNISFIYTTPQVSSFKMQLFMKLLTFFTVRTKSN